MKIINLKSVDSTNLYCKRLNSNQDVIVTAQSQTAGRGTKGRSFISDSGGLYISKMTTIKNFDGEKTFRIMIDSCVAVCRTVEKFGLTPVIRWANDVLVNGKKICGTLIENTFNADGSFRSIVGIGLNVNNILPQELIAIATTISKECGKEVSLSLATQTLIENLSKSYTVDEYRAYINWFGKEITLNFNGQIKQAKAVGVEDDGRLICIIDGKEQKISSAEVSLRL
jgi:BirA family biotin operon repressor/biotin-[acetyl-CoA-carboxylase] ligase